MDTDERRGQIVSLLKEDLLQTRVEYMANEAALREAVKEMRRLKAQHEAQETLISAYEPSFQSRVTFYGMNTVLFSMAAAKIEEDTGGGAETQEGGSPATPTVEQREASRMITLEELDALIKEAEQYEDDDVTPEGIALQIAGDERGAVRVQELADRLYATGRYKSESSAYGAAHSQLSRNERFEKIGRGLFTLKPPNEPTTGNSSMSGPEELSIDA